MNDTDLQTDEEALREIGFTDRAKKTAGITFRPMTALSLSWMQRNSLFDEGSGDILFKTAAFAFLHSEPKETIQSVVNDRAAFRNAVDDWIEDNVAFHTQLEPITAAMNQSMEAYMASSTKPAHPSDQKGPEAKN